MPIKNTTRALAFVALAAGALGACGSDPVPTATGNNNPAGPGTTAPAPGSTVVGTTQAPGTTSVATTSTSAPASSSTTSSTLAPAASVTTVRPGASTTIPSPSSTEGVITNSTIAPGRTEAEKAWCRQAKPVTVSLLNLYSLSPAQLEDLVNQARVLQPGAPAGLQPALTTLGDIGGRFLAAVKAGQATITPEGVTTWANANLTRDQQVGFLTAGGTVSAYVNATC